MPWRAPFTHRDRGRAQSGSASDLPFSDDRRNGRTSDHSWGTAIDIDTSVSDDWQNGPKKAIVWNNRFHRRSSMRSKPFDAQCRVGELFP